MTVASKTRGAQTQHKPQRGKVVQTILDMFDDKPDYAYTTADIAMAVYDTDLAGVTRSHRVAVQRAMKRAVDINPRLFIDNGSGNDGQLVIFDQTNVQSRAVAKYKSSCWVGEAYQRFGREYVWINGRQCNPDNHIKKWLKEEKTRQATEPGGHWYTLTKIATLRFNGDNELADRLEAEDKAARDARIAAMTAAFTGKRPEPTRDEKLGKIASFLVGMDATDEDMQRVVDAVKLHRANDGVASEKAPGQTQQTEAA